MAQVGFMNEEAKTKTHAVWIPEEAHNILKHRKKVSGVPISKQIVNWIYSLPEGVALVSQ